ncbi:MAG: lipocalin-like domain-containing protein [Dehalococcoidia bacterium]|nr:lipocalin-like domain-containing protein [Dehalococcoidia bacterium]
MAVDARFTGLWRLVSLSRKEPGGKVVYPFGESPVGYIAYYTTGHMGVHIMRRDRKPFAAGPGNATPEEKIAAFDTFTAYCGTYSVNEQEKAVIHHVQASSSPNNVGSDQKRLFTLTGNRLILRVAPSTANPAATEVVWEKVS